MPDWDAQCYNCEADIGGFEGASSVAQGIDSLSEEKRKRLAEDYRAKALRLRQTAKTRLHLQLKEADLRAAADYERFALRLDPHCARTLT
jgi:hypothetical protein